MIKIIHLLLFLLPTFLFSYQFSNGKCQLFTGYRYDNIHLQVDQSSPYASSLREKNNLWQIGLLAENFYSDRYYFQAKAAYALGAKRDASYSLSLPIHDSNTTYFSSLSSKILYPSREQAVDTSLLSGYQSRFGPLFLCPLLGVSYHWQHFRQKNIPQALPQIAQMGALIERFLSPGQKSSLYWLTTDLGLDINMVPMVFGRLQTRFRYLFHAGALWIREMPNFEIRVLSAQSQTTDLSLLTKASTTALGQEMHLELFYGMTEKMLLGFDFSYQYWRGKHGKSHQILSSNEQYSLPLAKSHWQLFSYLLSFTRQF